MEGSRSTVVEADSLAVVDIPAGDNQAEASACRAPDILDGLHTFAVEAGSSLAPLVDRKLAVIVVATDLVGRLDRTFADGNC